MARVQRDQAELQKTNINAKDLEIQQAVTDNG